MTQTDETVIAPEGFAQQIRQATWVDHGKAEHAGYMDELTAGSLTQYEYAEMIVQMWFVYGALEGAGERLAGDPTVAPFLDPALIRMPRIEADLDVARAARVRVLLEHVEAREERRCMQRRGHLAHASADALHEASVHHLVRRPIAAIDRALTLSRFAFVCVPVADHAAKRRNVPAADHRLAGPDPHPGRSRGHAGKLQRTGPAPGAGALSVVFRPFRALFRFSLGSGCRRKAKDCAAA